MFQRFFSFLGTLSAFVRWRRKPKYFVASHVVRTCCISFLLAQEVSRHFQNSLQSDATKTFWYKRTQKQFEGLVSKEEKVKLEANSEAKYQVKQVNQKWRIRYHLSVIF